MTTNVVRPPWDDFRKQTCGANVICTCGCELTHQAALREHWQLGHFDYVEGPNVIAATPDHERRIQRERRKDTRAQVADMRRRLAQIADLLEGEYLFHHWSEKAYRLAIGLSPNPDGPQGPQQPKSLEQPNNEEHNDGNV